MRSFILTVLLYSGTVFGGIEWKQETVELQVHPTQVTAEAVFHFSNTGTQPLRFSNIVPTCGCMTGRPEKSSYAPGEEGTFPVRIDLRNREGKFRKTVWVQTSDESGITLTVAIDIPTAYLIDTRMVRWEKGDDATQKTARLHNPNTVPIRLLSISSSHPSLPVELITIREGFEYEVVVSRKPDADNARSVIRISTAPPPGEEQSKTVKIYAFAP